MNIEQRCVLKWDSIERAWGDKSPCPLSHQTFIIYIKSKFEVVCFAKRFTGPAELSTADVLMSVCKYRYNHDRVKTLFKRSETSIKPIILGRCILERL